MKGEQCFLLAGCFNPYSLGNNTVCIDLASGELTEWPTGSVGIFLKWSISLHMGEGCFQPLLSFPVENEV